VELFAPRKAAAPSSKPKALADELLSALSPQSPQSRQPALRYLKPAR
jgi:hypothetical protein